MEPRALQNDVTGSGDPIVLVPGGLTGWLSWVPHAARLAASRTVIRVQPIHNELGSAGRPGDTTYTRDTEREALRLTIDALGIDRADFAGWSGGGRALIEFALTYPERIRTLTLVEPAAYWILEKLGDSVSGLDRVGNYMHTRAGKEITADDLAGFLELAGFVTSATDAPSHPNWERWYPHRNALSWSPEEMDRSDRSPDELADLRAPLLLVKGTITTDWLKRVVDVIGERAPNATVVELPGDHACHIQSIDAFLEALEKHLETG
ncbi:MAG: alpha/beta hydrolase [Actinomycetota bacterium]